MELFVYWLFQPQKHIAVYVSVSCQPQPSLSSSAPRYILLHTAAKPWSLSPVFLSPRGSETIQEVFILFISVYYIFILLLLFVLFILFHCRCWRNNIWFQPVYFCHCEMTDCPLVSVSGHSRFNSCSQWSKCLTNTAQDELTVINCLQQQVYNQETQNMSKCLWDSARWCIQGHQGKSAHSNPGYTKTSEDTFRLLSKCSRLKVLI